MKVIMLPLFLSIAFCRMASADECIDYAEMDFFNTIGGTLEVELTQEPESIKNLPGNKVAGKAEIKSIRLMPEIYVEETDSFRQLTDVELNTVAFNQPSIKLVSASNEFVEHKAPNNKFFTVKDLLKAVELTEVKTRKNTNWFGGVDIHHIYFEGIYCENGNRLIYWGS
jgi:hypothetical protein